VLDVVLDEAQRHDGREKFVRLALADTDRRIAEGKPVAPSFMLACMLWHDVFERWKQLEASGESSFVALQQAIDAVFDAKIGDISGRGRLAADMREVWMMQPRFARRSGQSVYTLIEQPRFRAGFDFLRLRGQAGEVDTELPLWWERFSTANADERERLIGQARDATPTRSPTHAPGADADPARKRRRRRRRSGPGAPEPAPLES
jgi:poly(A) polymerase